MKAYGLYLWYYSQLNDFILDNYSNLFHGILLFVGSNLRQVSVGSKCSRASTFSPKGLKFQNFFLPRSNTRASQPYDIRALPSDCWSEHSPPRTAYLAPGISWGSRTTRWIPHVQQPTYTKRLLSCLRGLHENILAAKTVLQNQPARVPCHRQNLPPFPTNLACNFCILSAGQWDMFNK